MGLEDRLALSTSKRKFKSGSLVNDDDAQGSVCIRVLSPLRYSRIKVFIKPIISFQTPPPESKGTIYISLLPTYPSCPTTCGKNFFFKQKLHILIQNGQQVHHHRQEPVRCPAALCSVQQGPESDWSRPGPDLVQHLRNRQHSQPLPSPFQPLYPVLRHRRLLPRKPGDGRRGRRLGRGSCRSWHHTVQRRSRARHDSWSQG